MVPKREVSFAPINGHCKRDEAHPKSARFGSGLNLLAVPMTHRSGLGDGGSHDHSQWKPYPHRPIE